MKRERGASVSSTSRPAKAGRPLAYPLGAVQKSFTLDSRLIRRLEERAGDNLSQTVNDLLERALEQEDMLAAAGEMAAAYHTSIEPDVEARALALLLGTKPRNVEP